MVNDQGEAVFVDLATGDLVAGIALPRPGSGLSHYLAASLDQALLVDGATTRSVTLVALSDAPSPTVGYHPAATAIHLIDNTSHTILPRSMNGASAGISFNADRGRHALVGFHQLPGSRIDARYGLRPPWLGYAVRHDDLVDFVAIVPPQDLDGDGNPDDDGNGIPDVGLAALEEGLGVVGSGGSATLRIFLHDSMRLDPDTADPEDCRPILPGEEFRETAAGSGVWFLSPRPHPGSEIHVFLDPARTNLIVEFVAYDADGNPIDRDGDTAADTVLCPHPNCPVWADPARLTLDPGGAIRIPDFPIGGTGCDGEREVFADIVTEFPTPSGAQQSAVSDALRFVVDHTGPSAEVEDATFVPTAGPVVVRFDEEVVAEPAWTRIVVREAGATSRVPGSLHERLLLPDRPGDPSRTALDFVPDTPLADWRNYEVVIPPDVTDRAGNPVAGSPDLVVAFRTRSALAEEMLTFFASVGVPTVRHVQRQLESSASWLLGRESFRQVLATRAVTEACLSPPVRAFGDIGLDEAAATAVLAAVVYSPDRYFHDETLGGGRAVQIVDRAALRIDRAAAVPAIRWTCEPGCDEGDPLPHRVPEFLTFVGFHAGRLRSNIEAAVAPARDPAATPAAAAAARQAAWEAVWSYVPNAFLTRYEALRDRGHIRVPAEQLQAALTEYLWWAGARHSPPDVMTGSCAGLEHGGAADRVECALRYLRSALSDEAAILAGAITSVLLSDSSGEDPRLTGWSLGEVDEVLAALADGRDLVDVATRTLLMKLGEIHSPGVTLAPSITAAMPPSDIDSGAMRMDFRPYAALLPADPSFDTASSIDPAIRTLGSTADGCAPGDLLLRYGAASIVAGEDWFQAYQFASTLGGWPRFVTDLRTHGIGVGDEYPSDSSDKALALVLMAMDDATGVTTESQVEVAFPRGAERIEFKYLYWAENIRPWLEPAMSFAAVEVLAGSVDGLGNPVTIGTPHTLPSPTEVVVAAYDEPCCPGARIDDAVWGTPCDPGCSLCRKSPAGPLCARWDTAAAGDLPGCSDIGRYETSCEAPYADPCVIQVDTPLRPASMAIHAATAGAPDPAHPARNPRYRLASFSRSDLGIPADDANGWVRIGLRNQTPDTSDPCPPDLLTGLRQCDSMQDRLQIDDLVVQDCAGVTLGPGVATAMDCGTSLEARVGEIGLVALDATPVAGVPVEVSTAFATETAFALRAGGSDGVFGWRIDATITPPPVPGIDPAVNVTCQLSVEDGDPTEFPFEDRDGLSFLCVPRISTLAGLPEGALLRAGAVVSTTIGSVERVVRVPTVSLVADMAPPRVPTDGRFDTFPACHGTFLEGETVLVWADVADDATLSTYSCQAVGGAPLFPATHFEDAHRIPAGRRQEVAFQWTAPSIDPPTEPFMDLGFGCYASDAVGRSWGSGFARDGRVVRVPPFGIRPEGRDYDDPDRNLLLVSPGTRLAFEPVPPGPELPPGSGLELRFEFAIEADADATYDPATGEFAFEEPGAYYVQGVVGRMVPACGTFDNVRLSQNVVVVVVEPYEAQIVTPDFLHLRGIAAVGAPYPQSLRVQLTDSRGDPVEREGVPLNVLVTGEALTFASGGIATSAVLVTDALGRASVGLYSTGFPSGGDIYIIVSRPAVGGAPQVELDRVAVRTVRIVISRPHGVPTGGTDAEIGTSEVCFDATEPAGALLVDVEATWEDGEVLPTIAGLCGTDPSAVSCGLLWRIEAVGASPQDWSVSHPTNAAFGHGPRSRATFDGLPLFFDDFGAKRVVLTYGASPGYSGGIFVDDQWIEVFYPSWGLNHPGSHMNAQAEHTITRGASGDCPDWFYYGVQVAGFLGVGFADLLYDDTLPTSEREFGRDGYGEVPAISQWVAYREPAVIALIGSASYVNSRILTISGRSVSYMVSFLGVVDHEATHVQQVEDFNMSAVPFHDGVTGRIANIYAPCTHTPAAPGVPCGWAFASNGVPVSQAHPYWNRYQEVDGLSGFSSGDVNLDPDGDLVPSLGVGGMDAHADPAVNDLELPAYTVEDNWVGVPATWDWASLGPNRGHSGTCPP